MDNRVQARVLGSKVLALMLGANSIPPLGGSIGVADIRSAAEADVTRILSTQQADGSYRFAVQCGYSSNFMTGLLNGVLGQYYTHVSPDPRIQGAVQKSYDYLFASQWLPSKKLFQYYSGVCSDSNTDPGGDLNGLFLDGLRPGFEDLDVLPGSSRPEVPEFQRDVGRTGDRGAGHGHGHHGATQNVIDIHH